MMTHIFITNTVPFVFPSCHKFAYQIDVSSCTQVECQNSLVLINHILIILNALVINALLLSFLRGRYWNFTLFQNSRLLSDLNVYAS